jgi:hypothetical protein
MWLQRLQADLRDGRPYNAEAWRQQACHTLKAAIAFIMCAMLIDILKLPLCLQAGNVTVPSVCAGAGVHAAVDARSRGVPHQAMWQHSRDLTPPARPVPPNGVSRTGRRHAGVAAVHLPADASVSPACSRSSVRRASESAVLSVERMHDGGLAGRPGGCSHAGQQHWQTPLLHEAVPVSGTPGHLFGQCVWL